jgi:hypothetical protein
VRDGGRLPIGIVREAANLGDGGRVQAFAGAGHRDHAEFAEDRVGVTRSGEIAAIATREELK